MEEKKLEQNEEVTEPSVEQTKDDVTELLEPTPYQNKYKKELDKEDSETATIPTDTSSEEEATPNEERPVNAEDKVFKKRYDDLKRHYDSTLSKHKEQAKSVENKLQSLEQAQTELSKEKAELELLKIHPDFKDIRKTDDFHEWAKNQDHTIQSWLYDNTSNHTQCARAIDLYKMDKGFTASKKSNKDVKNEAAKAITTTKKNTGKDITAKKTWTVSEISKLKPYQYVKYEKEIDLARREGRIVNN